MGLLLGLASCASTGEPEAGPPLPFHLAVVPVEITVPAATTEGDPGFELRIDGQALAERMRDTLSRSGFARATLLEPPSDTDPESFARWDLPRRQEWWVRAAEKAKADLLLVPRLRYEPEIRQEGQPWYVAVPSFLFLGPIAFFIEDRRYEADVTLTLAVHGLSPIEDRQATILGEGALLLTAETEFVETHLSFLQRAEGIGSYAQTLIMPSGWIAPRTTAALDRMADDVVDLLCRNGARELGTNRREEIVRAQGTANHFLDLGTLRIDRSSGGDIDLAADVLLSTDRGVDRMRDWRVDLGAESREGRFAEPEVEGTWLRYAIRQTLPVPPGVDAVRLTLREGGAPPRRRTYTLPIPGAGGR
jgi:hypothetical protein